MKNLSQIVSLVLVLTPFTYGSQASLNLSPNEARHVTFQPNFNVTPRVWFGFKKKSDSSQVSNVFRKDLIEYFHTRYPSTQKKGNRPDHEIQIILQSLQVLPVRSDSNMQIVDLQYKVVARKANVLLGQTTLSTTTEVTRLDEKSMERVAQNALQHVHQYLQGIGL